MGKEIRTFLLNGKRLLFITFIFFVANSTISCGDDKEEAKQETDIISGRWVVTCIRINTGQAYTNTLEKTWDFINYTQTISNVNSSSSISDHETKQYSSFEEMAEDVHLKGLIFEKNGDCKPIIYDGGGWQKSGDSFKYEIDNMTIYQINGNGKEVFGVITYNGNNPQIYVQKTVEIATGYNAYEDFIYVKY